MAEEVLPEDVCLINRDEEMEMYARKMKDLVGVQMVKFEKEVDVIEQDENENQMMK